jgi:hypothetical protein
LDAQDAGRHGRLYRHVQRARQTVQHSVAAAADDHRVATLMSRCKLGS